MGIMCQHNRFITVQEEYNVRTYNHEDGQPCEAMNSYGLTTARSLALMFQGVTQDRTQATIFLASREARLLAYRLLATMTNDDELRHALQAILDVIQSSQLSLKLIAELVTIFGMPMRHNLQVLGVGQLAYTQEDVSETTRLPIQKLHSGVTLTMSELEIALRQGRQNR